MKAAADEPLVLPVGTEVSAKYRGAFCEAKVKKIVRLVKCKVNITDPKQQITVQDEDIKGTLKVGSKVEVKMPDSMQYVEATISKLTDCSQYTVVFDDGDENTLRRTQLCLKGEKHFVKSETLDQLPLTHPEHFGTPVMKGYKGQKRRRSGHPGGTSVSESESESESSECSSPRKKVYKGRLHDQIGRVLCMELEDRKKTIWVPVLVVLPSASDVDLKTRDHLLVKSFKDSRFYSVLKREAKEFVRDMAIKNEDKALKPAMEKALAYFDTRDLPSTWAREELLGEDSEDEDESDTSDDEPSEEKDHFVAQLYKFMDDRGTPINKAPSIGSQDLNLYRLFKLVRNLGGYNKVTNLIKWKLVYSKMNLPTSSNAYTQIRTAYKKYLHAYEDFYRKLGSTMGSSRQGRTRHPGRNLLPLREREFGQPKSPRSDKKKEDKDTEESDDEDKGKVKDGDKSTDGKGKKDNKKTVAKDESEDVDSPRKRRSRTAVDKKADEKKKEEEKEERMTKRMTREDTAKLKEESKVKAEEERSRRSTSKKGEPEVEEKEEASQKRKSTRKKNVKEEKEDPKKKEEPVSDGGPDEDSEEEEDDEPPPPPPKEETSGRKIGKRELAIGTRLKVRYGRGRNQKIYEAKVIESEQEGNYTHYLVHYAGWNTRYDEWVQRDRIVTIVSEGTDADRKSIGNKTLKSPKSVVKKNQRPKPPTAANTKVEAPKTPKGKSPAPATNSNQKSRPTRSSLQETPAAVPPRRKSRRHGSAVGENTSDLQSHVSDSDSEDESISEDKKMDTDDADSLKAKSDKSSDSCKPKTYSKSGKGSSKKQEKETDVSESEPESIDSAGKETKGRGKTEKSSTSKAKADIKNEISADKEEDKEEEEQEKIVGKRATSPRPGKSSQMKSETAAEDTGVEMATIMENKAKDLMKDEDAQSEDDIIKDLKHNHHIDMGDILMDSDTDMPIATPKSKSLKDGTKVGKRRVSSDSTDKLCGRQDSMDTVAYGYDLHIQVENILQQLDEGDDDSDDLPFLTPTKQQKEVFQNLDSDKKEDTKTKKEKKTADKNKEKVEKTPKGKGKKKEKTSALAAMTSPIETKPESEGEKNKKPEVEKIKKKKKAKKKLEVKDQEKELDTSPVGDDKKESKEKTDVKPEGDGRRSSISEDAPPPPQLNLVTPTKEKDDLSKLGASGLEMSPTPPKLQAERLDLDTEERKEEKTSTSISADVSPAKSEPTRQSISHEQDVKPQQLSAPTIPTPESSSTVLSSPSLSSSSLPSRPEPSLPAPTAIVIPTLSSPSSLSSSVTSSSHPSSEGSSSKEAESSHKPAVLAPMYASPSQAPVPVQSQTSPSSSLATLSQAATIASSTTAPTAPSTSASPSKPEPTNTSTKPATVPCSSPKQTLPPTPQSQQSVFDNTPPETPEGSPEGLQVSDDSKSPTHTVEGKPVVVVQPEAAKTETAEGGSFAVLLPGAESPHTCDTSTISNGSEGSSSGNMPSSEDSTEGSVTTTNTNSEKKRKQPPPDEQHPQQKKRKRSSKRSTQEKGKSTPKHMMSDSDEAGEGTTTSPKRAESAGTNAPVPPTTTPNKKPATPATTPSSTAMPGTSSQTSSPSDLPRPSRTSNKYNLNLEEGEYLTGEKRISFLMEKLQEIRKIYMGLKAEVACIDRRKKRLKRREKEQGTALALASLANS